MSNLISASFIHSNSSLDGSMYPWLPKQLCPENAEQLEYMNEKQLKGTPMENLCEIAGRACYDSFGRGRVTEDFHKHILEVGHLSVIEHATFTVGIQLLSDGDHGAWAAACLNKPSIFVDHFSGRTSVTLNLRHVLEWEITAYEDTMHEALIYPQRYLGYHIAKIAHKMAPAIVPEPQYSTLVKESEQALRRAGVVNSADQITLVAPVVKNEHWLTFFLTGSRGFSHELVRHGDWTAISQRSTRYVDESESPWVEHPLVEKYVTNVSTESFVFAVANGNHGAGSTGGGVRQAACQAYQHLVMDLEKILIGNNIDKTSARKQARGAARGYLGNALYTEVVFSASVAQWLHMIKMRANPAADAEIREVFCQVVEEVQKPMFADQPWAKFFADIKLEPSPDGIGRIAVVP